MTSTGSRLPPDVSRGGRRSGRGRHDPTESTDDVVGVNELRREESPARRDERHDENAIGALRNIDDVLDPPCHERPLECYALLGCKVCRGNDSQPLKGEFSCLGPLSRTFDPPIHHPSDVTLGRGQRAEEAFGPGERPGHFGTQGGPGASFVRHHGQHGQAHRAEGRTPSRSEDEKVDDAFAPSVDAEPESELPGASPGQDRRPRISVACESRHVVEEVIDLLGQVPPQVDAMPAVGEGECISWRIHNAPT